MSEDLTAADVTEIHKRFAVQTFSAAAVEQILVERVMKRANLLLTGGTITNVKFMYAGNSLSSATVMIEQDLLYVAPPAEVSK